MSKKTREFEKIFAKKVGAKYAIMVDFGSSANLLSTFTSYYKSLNLLLKKFNYSLTNKHY